MRMLFRVAVRLEVAREARDLGLSFSERRNLLNHVMDEARLMTASSQFGVPGEYLVDNLQPVALGDGTILRAILDWLASEEGRAFIKFLIGLFMAL